MATNKFSASRTAATGLAPESAPQMPGEPVVPGNLRKARSVPVVQRHKAGDTWSTVGFATIVEIESGNLVDLSNWTIASQLRDLTGKLITDFQCQIVDPLKQIFTHIATDTKAWPHCVAQLDIRFTSPDGQVISTDTQNIIIERGVTL